MTSARKRTHRHRERNTSPMRQLLLLAAAIGVQTAAAMAADLGPVNVTPPVAFTWTGVYLGANVGGAWSTIQDNGLGGGSASGVIGGVSVGYNWQLAPFWVVGIEGDSSWADLTVPAGSGDVNWISSVRARLGWTATPTTLVYATGGVAWSIVSIPGVDTLPANQTKNGWVAGGGVEWMPWGDHWSIRAEYLYYRFTSVLIGAGFGGNLEVSEGRIGAAYKF
jgi:outer membrane immunogenic protein